MSERTDMARATDGIDDLAQYRALLDAAPDPIIAVTWEGIPRYCNRALASALGYEPDEFLSLPAWGWIAEQSRHNVARGLKSLHEEGVAIFASSAVTKTGDVLQTEVAVAVAGLPASSLLVAVIRVVATETEEVRRIRYLAFHDKLTGIANRTMFEECMEATLREADQTDAVVGVIYVDLDDFKPVNDAHGHAVGDAVLQVVARRMCACVRDDADMVARLGGDEFAVLLTDLSAPEQLAIAGRNIPTAISQPIQIGDSKVSVSASVGLAVHRRGEEADELLVRADHAMYRAKREGLSGAEEFMREFAGGRGSSERD